LKRVSEILEKTIKKMPNSLKIRGQLIIDAWPDVAGELIAAKTEPLFVEMGTLYVRVQDSVWAQHLSLQKISFINKLNRKARTKILKDIRFQVGVRSNKSCLNQHTEKEEENNWRDMEIEGNELTAIKSALCELDNWPELRGPMEKLIMSQKKWIRWQLKQGCDACLNCGMPVYPGHASKLCSCCRS
jgi:hypothetical protein